jgi:hypothetical protein
MLLKQKGFIDTKAVIGGLTLVDIVCVLVGTAVGIAVMKWLA